MNAMRALIAGNLLHRPLRTLITIIAVGAEVFLVVIIVGLTTGILTETAKRIEGVGADLMLQPPASNFFLAFSGAPMTIKIGEKLREIPHVEAVAPVLLLVNCMVSPRQTGLLEVKPAVGRGLTTTVSE